MIKKFLLLTAVVLFTVFFTQKANSTSISVNGNITSNTVWTVDTVKVIGDVTIDNGVTLTINPGVSSF